MDVIKAYSFRLLVWILIFMGVSCIIADVGFLLVMKAAYSKILLLAKPDSGMPEIKYFIYQASAFADTLDTYFIPVSAGIFAFLGFFLWFALRTSFEQLINASERMNRRNPEQIAVKVPDTKEKKLNDQRLFLHMMSVLQREGRLMDFFAENLEDYEDEQVGAAVRDIHENCKKAINKYLTLDVVVDMEEETEITIPPEFDPGAIKLTGNVTGEPPFNGVVRHKGWRVKELEMPTLSGNQNPDIIAPAEVEIS